MAQMLLTAKLLHPSSELETERWLQANSGAMELYGEEGFSTTLYRLYQAAIMLYNQKDFIEKELYTLCTNLFSERNEIIIYDLTNVYFEGQMLGCQKANFKRSKEKCNDCRLIGLAMAIDNQGYVRYSQLFLGNIISESSTLNAMLNEVEDKLHFVEEKPIVVMDAGISTEDTLEAIKEKGHDYVCVSRIRPASYTFTSEEATILTDNRGHKIEVSKISVQNKSDLFLL
jgi:transposase